MRNLKRALSLTLASVMLLGMMVVGSSAASYPDVEDTHNVEAIEVLQAIKVMVGDDNGNFGPDDQVNRAQMAVVMALLLDLDYDYYKGTNPFWDVPSWAEPYVAACYANGIVSGYNATTYGAGDPVTAVQAASMMMRALGYFQYDSDYKDGFELSTVKQASKISLFKDVNAAGNSAPLTRNQVAQLALNTLETGMVEAKKTTSDITVGSGDTAVSISGAVEYVYVTSKDTSINAAIDDVEASSIGTQNDSMILELGEKLFNGDLKKYGEKSNSNENEYDDFGRPSVTWTYKNDKIGTYAKKNDLVATYTKKVSKGDIYSLLSSAVRSDLESTASGSAKLTVTVDGYETKKGNTNADAATWYVRNSSDAIYTFNSNSESSRNGTLTEVYLDKDNNVDIVIVNTYVYQATSDYSSSRDDVKMAPVGDTALALKAGELTLNGEDFALTDIKTDDYLLVTATSSARNSATNYEVQSVKVAEKLEGEVTGYADQDSVTIDGTTYNYSATALKTTGTNNVRATTYTVGQNAIVVLDAYGYIIAVDEAVSSSSFVFIKDFGSTSGLTTKVLADAYFTDGTNEEITIDRVDTTKSAATLLAGAVSGKKAINTWYTYSINSDGKYVLYSLTSATKRSNQNGAYENSSTSATKQIVYNGKVDFMVAPTGITVGSVPAGTAGIANDKTIMLVKDNDGDVNVYTGTANIPDISLAKKTGSANPSAVVYYVQGSKTYAEYAFVDLEGTGATIVDGGDDTSFLYVLRYKDDMYGSNATRYFNYSVINSETGAEEKIPFENRAMFDANHPYELRYKPRTNNDNRITSLGTIPDGGGDKYFNHDIGGNGAVKYSNGALKIGNDNFVVADSKITLVIVKDASTKALLANEGNDHEFYFETQPQTVDSLLKDYKVTGTIAGATKSSTSSVIDTLYITVTHVGPGTPATPGEIGDALGDATSGDNVEFENANVGDSTTTVPAGVDLTLKGDVTGNGTIDATGTGANVNLDGANVGGNLNVTGTAVVSGAVSVATGKTLTLATATLSGTLSGAGNVTVADATVETGSSLTTSADVTMTDATVDGTLNANGNVTVDTAAVNGTLNLGANSVLTVNEDLTKGGSATITAAPGAQIVVDENATATGLLSAVTLRDENGDVIAAENIATKVLGKTFVWREENWHINARTTAPAGWYDEDYDPAQDGSEETEGTAAKYVSGTFSASSTETAATTFDVTIGGLTYPVAKEKTNVADQAAAWATAYNADTETNNGNWTAAWDSDTMTLTYKDDTELTSDPEDHGTTGGDFTDGDGSGTAATVTITFDTASTTETTATTFDVTINGKTYAIAKEKTTDAAQLAAWVAAYNEEYADGAYTAAVGAEANAGKLVLTAKAVGVKAEGADNYGTHLANFTGGTFTNGTAATPAA